MSSWQPLTENGARSQLSITPIQRLADQVTGWFELFAAGLSAKQILEEMPDLEMDDLKAALQLNQDNFTS